MANRYFVDALPGPGRCELRGDLAHHLGTVLRLMPGAEFVLCDGRGGECDAVVVAAHKGRLELDAGASRAVAPPSFAVHLAFAPPRWSRAEWLFEHGTEAGAAVFWPLWTSRTRPQGMRSDRWQRVVAAAAGQCDRAFLPRVQQPMAVADFLRRDDLPAVRLLAAAGAGPPELPQDAAAAVLLVGPEGGLAAEESAAAIAAGFVPCGLGPFVLRTETAALCGCTALWLEHARARRC